MSVLDSVPFNILTRKTSIYLLEIIKNVDFPLIKMFF